MKKVSILFVQFVIVLTLALCNVSMAQDSDNPKENKNKDKTDELVSGTKGYFEIEVTFNKGDITSDSTEEYNNQDQPNDDDIEERDKIIKRVRFFPFHRARPHDEPWGTIKPAPRPDMEWITVNQKDELNEVNEHGPAQSKADNGFYEIKIYYIENESDQNEETLTLYTEDDSSGDFEKSDDVIKRVRFFPFHRARPHDEPWGTIKPAPRP